MSRGKKLFLLTLMTFIAFALVIWRWLLNINSNSSLDGLLADVQLNLKEKGPKAALNYCREEKGLIPSLLYVAVADLIPSLHRHPAPAQTALQLTLIGIGVALIAVVHSALEH